MKVKFRVWNGHRMMNVEDGWQLVFFSGKGKIPWGLYDHTNARISDGQYGDVLMRYTTLKDMNGVEICEGDIVKWGHIAGHGEERPIRVAEVRIDPDIQFRSHHKQTGGPHTFHYGTFAYADTHNWLVVIGNIHEHPHLLSGGN